MSNPPRDSDGTPICLRVSYRNAEAAVREFVRTRLTGGVFIESRESMPVGTEFVCQLASPDLDEALEVKGRVASVVEQEPDEAGRPRYGLAIRYDSHETESVDAAIDRIIENQERGTRDAPRVPTALPLEDTSGDDRDLSVHDLSETGMQVDGRSPDLGVDPIGPGDRVQLVIAIQNMIYQLNGTIMWAELPRAGSAERSRFGIQFETLPDAVKPIIHGLMRMTVLPEAITIKFVD